MDALFDRRDRSDPRPATYREDTFSFLNRAAGPPWDRIRAELDRWYAAFPDDDGDLRIRFRSRVPQQHYPAWWELYLHRLFSCLGFAVDVHPEVSDSSGLPDFLLTRGGERLYVEAVTVFSGIVEEGRHGAREAEVMDAIDSIENGDFLLSLDFEQVGASTPRRSSITTRVDGWLSGLDPDVVLRDLATGGELPSTTLELGDWRLGLAAQPLTPEERGSKGHRPIGIGPVTAGTVNDREQLGKALRRKRGRYGRPDAPLVIAALSMSSFTEDLDIEQVLFGSQAVSVVGGDARLERQPDGLWLGRRASAQHMSGLLLGVSLVPSTCAKTSVRLWHHPWATRPLKVELPFPAARIIKGTLRLVDGERTASDVLGLPADWPGPEPPFSDD